METDVCCLCNGSGKMLPPKTQEKKMESQKALARMLKKKGYSVREIMALMNYKSTNSITHLLKN